MPMEIVCHDELAHGETKLGKVWGFFETRELLDGYLRWLNTPQKAERAGGAAGAQKAGDVTNRLLYAATALALLAVAVFDQTFAANLLRAVL